MFGNREVHRKLSGTGGYAAGRLAEISESLGQLAKVMKNSGEDPGLSREDGIAALESAASMVCGSCDRWREGKGDEVEEHLDYEVEGIHEILKQCLDLDIRMFGVYIDGTLEAFTIGSYNPAENMAVIHIEKANPEIRGLYQFINQQFLVQEFPDVALVNREDDLGQEGLRHAKMSYNPCGFARKYLVQQKNFSR